MGFKEGTEVEVLEKDDMPLKSWRPAKILSGNGRTYAVAYKNSSMDTFVRRVPRKMIRPRPPHAQMETWACGDIVEVFEEEVWKLAEIMKINKRIFFAMKLLASSKVVLATYFQLRRPQTWKDDRWISFENESMKCKIVNTKCKSKGRKLSCQPPLPCVHEIEEKMEDYVNQWCQESLQLEKLCKPAYPPVRPCRMKKSKKNGNKFGIPNQNLAQQLLEKVDAVNLPQNKDMAGFSRTNPVVRLELSDNESKASSVGSCSVANGSYRTSERREFHGNVGDAESFHDYPNEPSCSRKDEMSEAIHCLELDAYCSTLRSLYRCGSLSWEQELLLTNLRIALHISNDESRSVLHHLMSS
ncbi:hypothetical protein KSP39_PZI015736 [Platanthera zijinensis]|uniref:ENT domain-containing protein n=1 Tax=Platanthera zijinensis TaxID=2320716 RepID=A0AAP0B8P4_9ASPA